MNPYPNYALQIASHLWQTWLLHNMGLNIQENPGITDFTFWVKIFHRQPAVNLMILKRKNITWMFEAHNSG